MGEHDRETYITWPLRIYKHRRKVTLKLVKYKYGVKVWNVFKQECFYLLDISPCSPLKVNPRFGGMCQLYLRGRRISHARNQLESTWQAELFLMEMEVTRFSETSVDFQRTTRRYIPEDNTLLKRRCENLYLDSSETSNSDDATVRVVR
jgi:hypothetical protein